MVRHIYISVAQCMALKIAANSAARGGVNLLWRIEAIQQGLVPGMGAGIVPGLVIF